MPRGVKKTDEQVITEMGMSYLQREARANAKREKAKERFRIEVARAIKDGLGPVELVGIIREA